MARKTIPAIDRLLKFCSPEPNSGCWLWTASVYPSGYGQIVLPQQQHKHAHRLSYEYFVGPIPEGLDLDHLCRVRSCVNPKHLEPVSRSENIRRGLAPGMGAARNLAKTHCPHGHEYTEKNTYIGKNPSGKPNRNCRECSRIRTEQKRAHFTEIHFLEEVLRLKMRSRS